MLANTSLFRIRQFLGTLLLFVSSNNSAIEFDLRRVLPLTDLEVIRYCNSCFSTFFPLHMMCASEEINVNLDLLLACRIFLPFHLV